MQGKHEICRMRILIIAATRAEIDPFITENKEVEVLITGVGVPATMYYLQKRLQQNIPQLVIQAGIAGSFNHDIGLGKVVLVKQDAFADIGMEEKEKFKTVFQAGFASKDEHPFCDGWLLNSHPILTSDFLPAVKAITVNKVSDSVVQKQQVINNFSPEIESMEGAALHYVCLQEGVSFIQLRSISNSIGERDKTKWKLKDAIGNLNVTLVKLIQTIA